MQPSGGAPSGDSFDIDAKIFEMTRNQRVDVPPYPAVAIKLREVTGRERFATADVVEVVAADQSLAATILRVANSALFNSMGPASSLQQAVSRLGASEVARLALAAGLAEGVRTPGPLQTLKRQVWQEGVACAAVSQALARMRGLSPQDAFTAGLLHDFGSVVGIACLEQILAANPKVAARSELAWRNSLRPVSSDLGKLVASRWNLPLLLEQSISLRDPAAMAKSPHAPLLQVIVAAKEVVAALAQHSQVTAAELRQIPELRANELEPLAEMLPKIPATIAAFESETPIKEQPSKVVTPATTLGTEPLRPLHLTIMQLQPRPAGPFEMHGISSGGWAMTGEVALPERQLFESSFAMPSPAGSTHPPPLKLWASITRSAPEGGKHRMECKPFALDRDAKRRWHELVQSAPKA